MITADLTGLLLQALYSRKIADGRQLLARNQKTIESLQPKDSDTAILFYALSCWTEYEPGVTRVVRRLGDEYTGLPWPALSVRDWAWIKAGLGRMAYFDGHDTIVESTAAWIDQNTSLFGAVPDLAGTMCLTLAQSLKRRSLYTTALPEARKAREYYLSAGNIGMVALCDALLGWLEMQTGDLAGAHNSWGAARAFLIKTDDWRNRGNVEFYEGRRLSRSDQDAASCRTLKHAVRAYRNCDPAPRNLRRALMNLAEVHLRMAKRQDSRHSKRAALLRRAADRELGAAERRIQSDPGDIRNRGRLLLAKANRALLDHYPSLRNARKYAKEAEEFALAHSDSLIHARALVRRANIEIHASEIEDESDRKRCRAAHFLNCALAVAGSCGLQNHRLFARCHRMLGELYLSPTFRDLDAARVQLALAERVMAGHQDRDYLAKGIGQLRAAVEASTWFPRDPIILEITEAALDQPLEQTVQDTERAIVLAAEARVGSKPSAVCDAVGSTNTDRIGSHKRIRVMPGTEPESVIFVVTTSLAFSHQLEDTLHAVEYAIIAASCVRNRYQKIAVKKALHIRDERLKRHWPAILRTLNRDVCRNSVEI